MANKGLVYNEEHQNVFALLQRYEKSVTET